MKVIDLLNKIAKGEEVPKKIKFNEYIFDLDKLNTIYISEWGRDLMFHIKQYQEYALSEEIEIIEEQPTISHLPTPKEDWDVNLRLTRIEDKVKELIDVVNEMK